MQKFMRRFFSEEGGFLLSTEGVLIGTIAVIGMISGLVATRNAIVLELDDFAAAVGALNQAYRYTGTADASAATNTTAGGVFTDAVESTDAQSIDVTVTGTAEGS